MSNIYPVAGGNIIGYPYQGTHGKAFNQQGGSDNWESENAVDIAVPYGSPVYAVTSGTIGNAFGSLGTGGRFAGLRLHLLGGGDEYYYAHLSKYAPGIKPGATVKAGDLLGYSGEANGVAHLHFASSVGSPLTLLKGLPGALLASATGSAPTGTSGMAASGAQSCAGQTIIGIGVYLLAAVGLAHLAATWLL